MVNNKLIKLIETLKGRDTYEELIDKLKREVNLNISVSSVKKYISTGNNNRFPSLETLEKLQEYAKKIGVEVPSTDEIIAELHNKNIISLRRFAKAANNLNIKKSEFEVLNVPILSEIPSTGPILMQENFIGTLPMPLAFIKNPTNAFLLQVRGDDMESMNIFDGDLVLVQYQTTAENGQTIIARIDNKITCKRYYRVKDKIILEPLEKMFNSLPSTQIEVIGVVTRIIKKVD